MKKLKIQPTPDYGRGRGRRGIMHSRITMLKIII
jgi:hypothetical protein